MRGVRWLRSTIYNPPSWPHWSRLTYFGQKDEGCNEVDALAGGEERELGFPERMSVDPDAGIPIRGREALFEGGDGFIDLEDQGGYEHLLAMGAQDLDYLDELAAVDDALGAMFAAQGADVRGRAWHWQALDEFRVDGTVFGDDAPAEAKMVDGGGIADGESENPRHGEPGT